MQYFSSLEIFQHCFIEKKVKVLREREKKEKAKNEETAELTLFSFILLYA